MEKIWRFRSRKKSKGKTDAAGFTSFADAESTYSRSGSSPWQPSTERPSIAVSRPADTLEVSHGPLTRSTEWKAPGSSGRMQPILIGISRPFDEKRPSTAGSMQRALDQVAESVNASPINPRIGSPNSALNKSSRYVDILAITTSPKTKARTYNEDIASRNIDPIQDENQHEYKPTSKYQEEVALRNAHQITPSRDSSLRTEIVSHDRANSLSSTGDAGSYQHRGRTSGELSRPRASDVAHHSRQNASRARENGEMLPAIPQERSTEDFSATERRLALGQRTEIELERAKERWMDVRKQNRPDLATDVDKPLPAAPKPKDIRDSAQSSQVRNSHETYVISHNPQIKEPSIHVTEVVDMYASDEVSLPKVPSYTEAIQTPPGQSILTQRSATTNRTSDSSRRQERLRSPSVTSNTPYRRAFVGNRTIMDLTGSDGEEKVSRTSKAGASSVSSYLPTRDEERLMDAAKYGTSSVSSIQPAKEEESMRYNSRLGSVSSHRQTRDDDLIPPSQRYGTASMASVTSYRQAMSVASYQQTPVLEDARADAFSKALPVIVDHSPTNQIPPQALSLAPYQQTPIIEDARSDAFSKVSPAIVDHSPTNLLPPQTRQLIPQIRERDSVIPHARWSSAREPVLDLDQLKRHSQAVAEGSKMPLKITGPLHERRQSMTSSAVPVKPASGFTFSPIQTVTMTQPPRSIDFSGISTLTSTSPRASMESIRLDTVTDAEMVSDTEKDWDVQPNTAVNSKSSSRISANIVPLVRIFADVKPEETKEIPPVAKNSQERPVEKTRKTSSSSVTSKAAGKRRERTAEEQAIRIAAKSIIPAGPLDKEPLPGVKTRDFAVNPTEKPANKRVEVLSERKRLVSEPLKSSREKSPSRSSSSSAERKSRTKSSKSNGKLPQTETPLVIAQPKVPDEKRKSSKRPSKSTSSASKKSKSQPKYNDEAYKKKHAEANAALLRLQQSLRENFVEESRSEFDAFQDMETRSERALSPELMDNTHAAAALAMIDAATTPRSRLQAQMRQTRSIPYKKSSDSLRAAQPSRPDVLPRSATDTSATITRNTTLTAIDPRLTRIDLNNRPPPSPGEVSLSAFPIPTPRAMSPDSPTGPPAYVKDVGMPVRRGSQSSRMSTASAFSIPFTMVPHRLGSLPEYRVGIPGPSNSAHMNSIASVTSSAGYA